MGGQGRGTSTRSCLLPPVPAFPTRFSFHMQLFPPHVSHSLSLPGASGTRSRIPTSFVGTFSLPLSYSSSLPSNMNFKIVMRLEPTASFAPFLLPARTPVSPMTLKQRDTPSAVTANVSYIVYFFAWSRPSNQRRALPQGPAPHLSFPSLFAPAYPVLLLWVFSVSSQQPGRVPSAER